MNKKTAGLLTIIIAVVCACGLWTEGSRVSENKHTQTASSSMLSPSSTIVPTHKTTTLSTPTTTLKHLIDRVGIFPEAELQSLDWLDGSTAWAIDIQGSILRAADQDENWIKKFTPPTELDSTRTSAHFFLDADNAWVLYKDALGDPLQPYALFYTHNAGQEWQRGGEFPNDFEPFSPASIYFINPQQGWFLGQIYPGMHQVYALLYATQDGGATWELIHDGTPLNKQPDTILPGSYSLSMGTRPFSFLDPKTGYAGIYDLFETTDGGRSWLQQDLLPPPSMPALSDPYTYVHPPQFIDHNGILQMTLSEYNAVFCPPCDIYAEPPTATYLYITHDDGVSWHPSEAPARIGTAGIANKEEVWFLGRQDPDTAATTLFWSHDYGTTWIVRAATTPLPLGAQLNFIDSQHVYAAHPGLGAGFPVHDLPNTADHELFFYRSFDGGVKWEQVKPE
jgi:hypothetical protein